MKKVLIFFILLFFSVGLVFAEDPVVGLWKSLDKKGNIFNVWHFYEKDGKLFGELLAVVGCPDDLAANKCKESYEDFPKKGKVNKMACIGTPFIFNLERQSAGNWINGKSIDLGNGKLHDCKASFYKADGKKYKEDTLKLHFQLLWVFGKNVYMTHASESDIRTIKEINKTKEFPADYPRATE